jgi:hypothetical protein
MSNSTKKVSACRVCKVSSLEVLIDFGQIALTGVFIENGKTVKKEPMVFTRCLSCGLIQLGHNYSHIDLYGDSYGYESHLNSSMVKHLQQKARTLERMYLIDIEKPVVVDIASNDGTLLSGYQGPNIQKIGIDPLISVLSDHYPKNCKKVSTFFSSQEYWKSHNSEAHLVTSLSVIYDLEDPVNFARQVFEILSEEGIWHFEQSYLPLMLQTNSYDTICHEHLLYLSLHNIVNILEMSGFKLKEVSINSVNGGSISVTAIKTKLNLPLSPFAEFLMNQEKNSGIIDGSKVKAFLETYKTHSADLKDLISSYKSSGYDVVGFGASTKGNSLIQLLRLDANDIRVIGEINPRKFGKQTPGSSIPIVAEEEIIRSTNNKTVAVVFPWHFRENLLSSLEAYFSLGGKLLFPLPQIEVSEI